MGANLSVCGHSQSTTIALSEQAEQGLLNRNGTVSGNESLPRPSGGRTTRSAGSTPSRAPRAVLQSRGATGAPGPMPPLPTSGAATAGAAAPAITLHFFSDDPCSLDGNEPQGAAVGRALPPPPQRSTPGWNPASLAQIELSADLRRSLCGDDPGQRSAAWQQIHDVARLYPSSAAPVAALAAMDGFAVYWQPPRALPPGADALRALPVTQGALLGAGQPHAQQWVAFMSTVEDVRRSCPELPGAQALDVAAHVVKARGLSTLVPDTVLSASIPAPLQWALGRHDDAWHQLACLAANRALRQALVTRFPTIPEAVHTAVAGLWISNHVALPNPG